MDYYRIKYKTSKGKIGKSPFVFPKSYAEKLVRRMKKLTGKKTKYFIVKISDQDVFEVELYKKLAENSSEVKSRLQRIKYTLGGNYA